MAIKNKLPKPPKRDRGQTVAEVSASPGSVLPHIQTVLATLLRDLNSDDDPVRYQAAKALLLAFPSAEGALAGPIRGIESHDRKVRLAAIERIVIVLVNALRRFAGVMANDLATAGTQSSALTEDLMEHAGRWIAWTQDRQRLLAVADSFADVMALALKAGEPDPYVKKAPGVAPKAARKPLALLNGESPDILEDVRKIFRDPQAWLGTPNQWLGGEKPCDLVGTERARGGRYLLRGIADGITT